MELKLSHEIIDQIIFGMENQDQHFAFDLETLEVVGEDSEPDVGSRSLHVGLPEWNSTMGFNLMEKFVANLRNPIYREILRESLAAGKGVFRRFKNALKEREEIEQLWYQFKEREMRQYVIDWFVTIQEARHLESVEFEEEDETTELVISDFLMVYPEEADMAEYAGYDRASFYENFPDLPSDVVAAYYLSLNRELSLDGLLRAETPKGELAGFLCFTETEAAGDDGFGMSRIIQLYTLPEFRGLGLGKAVFDRYLADSYRRGVEWVFAEIGGEALGFADRLMLDGFTRIASGLVLDLHKWGMENLYS
jgi:ribosomal protein S18 acetylase RimI-like enzyme